SDHARSSRGAQSDVRNPPAIRRRRGMNLYCCMRRRGSLRSAPARNRRGDMFMPADPPPDYSLLDRPEVLACLFHPRRGYRPGGQADDGDPRIPVADGVVIGGRCHWTDPEAVTILFFHGNGEIAEDYDDLGPLFAQRRINFLVADYRGYGSS
ncbi:hypothetical protein RZS08_16110, partial [Arthrospira platensis SPKY1]|nr:hypothetical protein [Arthrospira platensis SPKY1]